MALFLPPPLHFPPTAKMVGNSLSSTSLIYFFSKYTFLFFVCAKTFSGKYLGRKSVSVTHRFFFFFLFFSGESMSVTWIFALGIFGLS